jgi:hypothetical protein
MADQVHDAVHTRAKSMGRVPRLDWVKAGLIAARQARDPAERAEFLDLIGVTEALGLALPTSPPMKRVFYGSKLLKTQPPP